MLASTRAENRPAGTVSTLSKPVGKRPGLRIFSPSMGLRRASSDAKW